MPTVIRRSRVSPPQTIAPLGVKMMRRVEVKGSPREPHWYVDSTTDHEAIHKVSSAKGLNLRADQLHITHRY